MYPNSKGILSLLEALVLVVSIRDGVLKMTKGSMGVMKGVHRNNLYYLKGSTVIGQVEASISSDDGCTQVWRMKVGQRGERSLQAPAKEGIIGRCCFLLLRIG